MNQRLALSLLQKATKTRRPRPRFVPLAMASVVVLLAASGAAAIPVDQGPAAVGPGALAGEVTDNAGHPLAGARVRLVELERAALTGESGVFSFPGLTTGRYTLEVRRPGYAAALRRVRVPMDEPVTVALREDPMTVDPVTVTVTRNALSPLRSPLPASAVDGDALKRMGTVSLAHTVDRLPGVRTLATGREIGKPVIRGLAGARVLVLSQGLRLEDYAWSDEDGPSVDAALVDRIEVVRGPATVMYGPDAVGGVVNVIPRPIPYAAEGQSILRGEAELRAATNNREGDLVLRGEGAQGPWGWRATMAARVAEALHTPRGELENTGFGAFDGELAAVRRGAWGNATARWVHNGGEFKLLEEDAAPDTMAAGEEEGGPERKLSDDRLQLLGEFPLGSARLETRFQGQRHHMIEMEDDPGAQPGAPPVEVPVFDLVLNTGLGEAVLHHYLASDLSGAVGLSGEIQRSTGSGEVALIPDAGTRSAGMFLTETLEHGPLTVLGGARGDVRRIDADGHAARTFQALTWSLGSAWKLAPVVSLTANAGTAWRAPTLFEMYASGPRLGEARYEIGRADLEAERSFNLDAGLRLDAGRVRGSVSAFRNHFPDFLFIQPTDSMANGYEVFRYAQAEAELTGIEAGLELQPTAFLSLGGTADYVRGTNLDRDEPLPLMPPGRVDVRAELHGPWPGFAERAHFGAEVEHVAAPDRLNPYDVTVDAYTLLNFSAGFDTRAAGHSLSVALRVHNATNTAYRDFLSRYKRFALDPGRDLVLSVRTAL